MKIQARVILLSALLIALLVGCASNEQTLQVKNAWARPAASGENSAVYFVIANTGQADRLLSASGDVAHSVEVHMSQMDSSGMMQMIEQDAVDIPANSEVEFKMGGLHVMLVELTRDLKNGETITITLHFEKAGPITVDAGVKMP